VGPKYAGSDIELQAGPQGDSDWPEFPVLRVTFDLSDGSEPSWNNFLILEIRHYDRTTGDQLRYAVEHMAGRWGMFEGTYEYILPREGLEAAKKAFRDNLSVESGPHHIEFHDAGTHHGFALYRTRFGTVRIDKAWCFRRRCKTVTGAKRAAPAISVPEGPALKRFAPASENLEIGGPERD
jgi:hypothetical protein